MKQFFLLVYVFLGAGFIYAQNSAVEYLTINGEVLNLRTKSPLEAIMVFEKQPYGSIVGVTKPSTADGNYNFTLFDESTYLLTISSEGFKTMYDTIHGDLSRYEGKAITRDYYMIPIGVGSTIRLDQLSFDQGRSEVKEEAYAELNQIVQMLNEYPNMKIQLEGHTDFRGSARLNQELSERRAEAVKQYIVNQGIDQRRIKTKGYGGSEPITRENTDDARSLNMRVEVRIFDN